MTGRAYSVVALGATVRFFPSGAKKSEQLREGG